MGRKSNDQALVERVQRGDKAAFDVLVARYQHKVVKLIMRYVKDQAEALDVAQEAFIKAYRAMPRFRGDSAFYTWLYRIAHNACLMRIRKKKLQTVSLDRPLDVEEGHIERDVTDWSTDPRTDVMSEELSSVLTRHINELSPDNRIVFVLRDIHGLSTDDTANVLGLTVPAVKSRLHRARLYLRDRLKGYFEHGV